VKVYSVTPDEAMTAAVDAMSGPFDRRRNDCWRAAARAFQRLFGVDPMGPHSYATLSEARALIRAGGGPDEYCASLAEKAGLVEAEPQPGLIGMVATDGNEFDWSGGICIEPGVWAVKRGARVSFLPEHIRCWGVPWVAAPSNRVVI